MQAGRRPLVTQARRGLGGEKCPCGSHHGYVRAAALAPRGPGIRPGRHVGNCPDGGGAGTKVHELASACLWPAPKWWDGPAWRVSGVGSPRPPAFFCGGRCVFEFAPRTGTSVAPAIAAETVRLVETKNIVFNRFRGDPVHEPSCHTMVGMGLKFLCPGPHTSLDPGPAGHI